MLYLLLVSLLELFGFASESLEQGVLLGLKRGQVVDASLKLLVCLLKLSKLVFEKL